MSLAPITVKGYGGQAFSFLLEERWSEGRYG